MSRRVHPVVVGILVYVVVMSAFSLRRYWASSSGDEDYAIFDQSMWTTLHERLPMWNSVEGGSHFGIHVSPIFWLALPLYAILPGAPMLLVLQTAALGLAAWPLYLLARMRLSDNQARTLAILYLFYHPVHGINYDQINELAYAPLTLMTCLYGLAARRPVIYWTGLSLFLMVKEDMALVALFLGMLLYVRRQPRLATATVAVALLWLYLALAVVRPHFATPAGDVIQARFGPWGSTLPTIVSNMATHPLRVLSAMVIPDRFQYVPEMLAPLAFLSLGTPGWLWVGLPTWVANLLSSFGSQSNTTTRYSGALIPLLFMAAVETLARWPELRQRRALQASAFLTLGFSFFATPVPPRWGFQLPPLDPHQRTMLAMAAMLPTGASLSTQAGILTHACHRHDCFVGYRPDVDLIAVDRGHPQAFQAAGWPQVLPLLAHRYHQVYQCDGLEVYARDGFQYSPNDAGRGAARAMSGAVP